MVSRMHFRVFGRCGNGLRSGMVPSFGTHYGSLGLRVFCHPWNVPLGSRTRKYSRGTVGRTNQTERCGDNGGARGPAVSGGPVTKFLLQPPSSVELRPLYMGDKFFPHYRLLLGSIVRRGSRRFAWMSGYGSAVSCDGKGRAG